MAIDDVNKRTSVVGVGRPFLRSHWPATIDQSWRLSVGNAYSGNILTPSGTGVQGSLAGEGGLAGAGGLASYVGGLAG